MRNHIKFFSMRAGIFSIAHGNKRRSCDCKFNGRQCKPYGSFEYRNPGF